MTHTDLPPKLADILTAVLSEPTPAPGDVARFAEVSLGLADAGALRDALAEEDGAERQALAELLLFPDRGLRERLEPELPDAGLPSADEAELASLLAGTRARFLLADGGEAGFGVSADEAALFVRRLRASRALPAQVAAALEPLAGAAAARVRLRGARFPWTPAASFLIRTLALRLGGEADFPDLLDWCCLFLEALASDADHSAELARVRLRAERDLKAHLAFQERLAASNFETMLLSGERAPHADPEALERDMRSAERIRLAVFGLSAAGDVADRDLGGFQGEDGVRDMLRLLRQ